MTEVVTYIGLGSNLGDSPAHVNTAFKELQQIHGCEIISCSSLYLSEPMGPKNQPDFVNAVAAVRTMLSPWSLLDALQNLEQVHRRVQSEPWGPRTLDLDILLYGDHRIMEERLQIPHPGIVVRNFVLVPLAEIAADLVIPGMGMVSELVSECDQRGLQLLGYESRL